jgi:hypothetical protein
MNSCTPGLADRLEFDGISPCEVTSHNEPRPQAHFSSAAAGTSSTTRSSAGRSTACFRRWCYGRARKSSFTARHPVPIVDEALLALQQLGWPKGPRHVQHMYNIGQSDTREAVTLADCWSHQPGRRSTMPTPALSRSAGSRLVHRSAPRQSWGFDGEPPKALVIKDSGTKDGTS